MFPLLLPSPLEPLEVSTWSITSLSALKQSPRFSGNQFCAGFMIPCRTELFPVNTVSIIPLFSFKSLLMLLTFVLHCSLQCPTCWYSVTPTHAQRSLSSPVSLWLFVSLFSFSTLWVLQVGMMYHFLGGAWCLAQWDLGLWVSYLEVTMEEIPEMSHWLGWDGMGKKQNGFAGKCS